MAYCTQADLEERYGTPLLISLTDRDDVATGLVDASVVAEAIADAAGEIDGYVKGRYTLPFVTVPEPIPGIAKKIAIYNLHTVEPDAKIVRDYQRAIKQLEDIQRGVIQLDAAGVTPEQTDVGGAVVSDREQAMTIDSLKGFI